MREIEDKYTSYATDVISGKIIACDYVRLACERYLKLFERDDLIFCPEKIDRVVNFISKLKHFTGGHSGKRFILSDWQKFIMYSIYGFYHKSDGTRLVRNAYIEISRKNGKTALVAAMCLYHLIADGEQNAQVILSATSAKQAKICFDMCVNFIRPLDPKGKFFKRYRDSIKFARTNSELHIVAADASRLDGYNASMYVCDELHEFQDGSVFNVLQSSTGMREQPLGVCITTAGFNQTSFCYDMRSNCIDILHGIKSDDSQFCIIYTLDEDDDYRDEKKWVKCSPNLGTTVKWEYLRQQLVQAQNNPALLTNFLTKLMNKWVSSVEEWLPNEYINRCMEKVDIKDYRNCYAFVGQDLGSTGDLTALTVMIPPSENNIDKYVFKTWYFLPEAALNKGVNADIYRKWYRQGYLNVTKGNVTDYDHVLNVAMELQKELLIQVYSYDEWNAAQYTIKAEQNGLPMRPYSQSIGSMNRPTKELARLISSEKVLIDSNPITRWCFQNVVIKRDWNENEKIVKTSYGNKIDGVIGMVMALGGYLASTDLGCNVTAL